MVLATKKNCQGVLAASLRVVSAMTGNPPLCSDDNPEMPETSKKKVALRQPKLSATIIWRYRTV